MKLTTAQVTILIVLSSVLILGVVAALAFTSAAAHEDSDVFVTRLTTLVGVAIGAVGSITALFKVTQVQKDVQTVKTQTNGPLTQMASDVSDIHASTVTPPVPPTTP